MAAWRCWETGAGRGQPWGGGGVGLLLTGRSTSSATPAWPARRGSAVPTASVLSASVACSAGIYSADAPAYQRPRTCPSTALGLRQRAHREDQLGDRRSPCSNDGPEDWVRGCRRKGAIANACMGVAAWGTGDDGGGNELNEALGRLFCGARARGRVRGRSWTKDEALDERTYVPTPIYI